MKTLKIILNTVFALISLSAFPQESGVYLTATDFALGKLTYSINCATQKHKIKLNEFLSRDYITVVHNKEPHQLKKNEIFGYRDCDEKIYRLTIDRHYELLNPKERILLYKIETPPSKNQRAVVSYYFSASASDGIKELTLENLKGAFPDNHKFHDALTAEFKTDSELAQYDSHHKVYRVNRLFSNSLM